MEYPLAKWIIFLGIVLFLLFLDLGVFNKDDHEIEIKESLYLSSFYITIGLLFTLFIVQQSGIEKGREYLTGYLIEKSLSLDNIFVISLIFKFLKVPRIYQHRVLFWGIIGVIFLRGLMIGLGAKLVEEYGWVLYIFSVFLIYTGVKMLLAKDEHNIDIAHSRVYIFMHKHLRITSDIHGHHFFVRLVKPGTRKLQWYCTRLLLALVMIETIDLVFAIDSVPAIFTITTDTYVVYTSNIFAILGLRALYFALAAILARFAYLKYALSLVLIFIGAKIFIADWLGLEKFPASISLSVTLLLLVGGMVLSLWKTRRG